MMRTKYLRSFLRARGLRLAFALMVMTPVVRAEAPARDPIAAEALFESGKKLLKAGEWTLACSKFDKSMELDPSVSALIKVARCRAHEGKLAAAWYAYQQALGLNRAAKRADLEALIRKELSELEPRVPAVTIALSDPPPDLVVRRDGQPVPQSALGEELLVDPGPHEIEASAPGYVALHRTFTIAERQRHTVMLVLTAKPSSPGLPPAGPEASAAAPAPAPSRPDPAPVASGPAQAPGDRASVARTAGFALAGSSLVGFGVAIYFGARTVGLVSESNPHCQFPGGACDSDGVSLRSRASSFQVEGILVAGVATAVLATGVVLVLTHPLPARATVGLSVDGVRAGVSW